MDYNEALLVRWIVGGVSAIFLVIWIIWMWRRTRPPEPLPPLFVDSDSPFQWEKKLEAARLASDFALCRYGPQVSKRVAGTLDPDRIADVSYHINNCESCLGLAILLKQIKEGRSSPTPSASGAGQR